MRIPVLAFLVAGAVAYSAAGDQPVRHDEIVVQRLQGDVTVRHGVTEVWAPVAIGDLLRPDDSMKIGKKGSAMLLVRMAGDDAAGSRRISLPPEVIIDVSDIRNLSPEELMLKLTMEKVRASSYRWRNEELRIPNASVVHGSDEERTMPPAQNDLMVGEFQLNGARVLFNNGFYSTCALKSMEVFRLYPVLGAKFENRLLMADAFARAELKSEAISEYSGLSQQDNLSVLQKALVNARIAQLRQQ